MKPIATQNGERIVAMTLMAVVTWGAFWVRDAAAAAEMAAATRERQSPRFDGRILARANFVAKLVNPD